MTLLIAQWSGKSLMGHAHGGFLPPLSVGLQNGTADYLACQT